MKEELEAGRQPFTIEDLRKLIRRRPKPYEWYRRDLKRKRPQRKQGIASLGSPCKTQRPVVVTVRGRKHPRISSL